MAVMTSSNTSQQSSRKLSADWLTVARHTFPQQGAYTQETFLALWGACIRWACQVATKKTPLTVTVQLATDTDVTALKALLTPLESNAHITLKMTSSTQPRANSLLIAGLPIHAGIYFQQDLRRSLQRYRGGWSFSPPEVQALFQVIDPSIPLPSAADANPHPEVATMASALVHGLEEQAKELDNALQDIHTLNQKVVNSERLAAIGQLCSVVAHEIRNPLGLIDLYAKLIEAQAEQWVGGLQETYPDLPELKEKLPFTDNIAMVRDAIGGLEVILSELTQYSRPLTLEANEQLVVPMVKKIVAFYQPKYAEKDVNLSCHVNPALVDELMANVDEKRFRQALLNLLKNALEACKSGATVSVTIASRENDKDIYIKVTDEGGGIPKRSLEKLFTPYFSTKGNGTGLGLAHSRKILQAHGGRVELLNTQEGVGTTFALVLPRVYS